MADTPGTVTPSGAVVLAPTKPGYKTTEFWLSLAAMLLGAAYASGVISSGSTVDKVAGFAAMALSALGYSVSRGMAKAGQ